MNGNLLFKRCMSFLLVCVFFFYAPFVQAGKVAPIYTVSVQGGITPTTAALFKRALSEASAHKAQALLVQLDTSGGLLSANKAIVTTILKSSVPVITYIPSHETSAGGLFIVYASHLAAMAPDARLSGSSKEMLERNRALLPVNPVRSNVLSDASSYLRALGVLRHRNADWVSQAVLHGASLSAKEAKAAGVIQVIAPSVHGLLHQLDGQFVMVKGREHVLKTNHADLITISLSHTRQLMQMLTEPSVVYLLLTLGVLGILLECFHPGLFFPGIVGVLAFSLALFALQWLPTNVSALFLLGLGLLFLVLEAIVMTYGVFSLAGIVAFFLGSVMLFKQGPTSQLSVPIALIVVMAAIWLLVCVMVFRLAVKARRRLVVSGIEAVIGQTVSVHVSGVMLWVRVQGERWQCECAEPLADGQVVRILRVDGLTLWVEPVND